MNIGEKEYASGLTYPALNYVKKIAFDPFTLFHRIMNIFKSQRLKNRLVEEARSRLRKQHEERLRN